MLIFIFLALRYDFGNDYRAYFDSFFEVSQVQKIDFNYLLMNFFEPGWVLTNWLFRHIGFFSMTAILAFISCVVYYIFIKKYVPVKCYWFAIFIYIFNPTFLLIDSSAMRQSVAIILFIFSLDYIYKKDFPRYFLCIFVAALFHFSAIILLPVFLITFFNKRVQKISGIFIFSLYLLLFIFGDALSPHISQFVTLFYEKYEFYQEKGKISSGLGFLYYSIILLIVLYSEKAQNREVELIFKIAIVYFLLMPLGIIIEMSGRFGMYFAPAIIIVYPNILNKLKGSVKKISFLLLIILFTIFQFFQFFYSDIYSNYFMNYQTIFSAPKWY